MAQRAAEILAQKGILEELSAGLRATASSILEVGAANEPLEFRPGFGLKDASPSEKLASSEVKLGAFLINEGDVEKALEDSASQPMSKKDSEVSIDAKLEKKPLRPRLHRLHPP